MKAAKCFRSSLDVEDLEVSDLCRIREFCTGAQHKALRDGEYRGEQSGASGKAFRRTHEGECREFVLECNRDL